MSKTLKPFKNISPGDIIKEELESKNWVQEDLAYVIDISLKHMNEIINNKKSINLELAKLLGKVFNKTPQYWLNLDTDYRLKTENSDALKQKDESVEIKSLINHYLPINEMFKKGWLVKTSNANELQDQVIKFLDKKTLDFSDYEKVELPAFSKSQAFKEFNPWAANAWYYMAKNISKTQKVAPFNKSQLTKLFQTIHSYTVKDNGVSLFLNELNKVGVKFIYLSHLQKTYIDGAAFYDHNNPVIVYTCRYNRIDNFWFTISHEIVHILRHLEKGKYIIDIDNNSDSEKEKEANKIAAEMLLENSILSYFEKDLNYLTEEKLMIFSKANHIHPSIIVGILAHNNLISFSIIHKFSETIKEKIPSKYSIESKN